MSDSFWYDHTTYPSTGAHGDSSALRAELETIATGLAQLGTPVGNASKLIAAKSDESGYEAITTTGTGSGVRATSPTLVTPALGVATATSINKNSFTTPANGCTWTLVDGKTFTCSITATLTGVDGSTLNIGTGGTLGTAAYTASSSYAVLTTNTFTGAQILSDQQVSRAMFIDCGSTYVDKGNSGTSTQTLDYTAGSHQKITATGNFTIATSNWPPTGNLGVILLEAVNFGAYTETWPTINWIKPDGTTTTSVSTWLAANTGRTSFNSSGTDFVVLFSRDAGTTIYGKFV